MTDLDVGYDYIRRRYGIDIEVGADVQHTVTGRFGRILPAGRSGRHYVRVLFSGDRRTLPCHPDELVFVGRAAI